MGDRDSRPIFFIVISLWLSRIHNKSTLYIVDSLRFQYPYCEFTINSLSLSWIYFEFFIISLCLSYSLRIYSDYRASTLDFWWNDYLYCEFTIYPLCLWQIHFEFTTCIANRLCIHYLFDEVIMNPLSVVQTHFLSIIFFTNWLRMH